MRAVEQAEASGDPLIAAGDYVGLLATLAALRDPVDHYFDNVMVMADDEGVRRNRLALLARIRSMFLRVADVSMLPAAGAGS